MAKISKPILYTGVLGIIAYAVVIATEPETETTAPRKRAARPISDTRKLDIFLPEDEKARFASLNESPRNAFKPLVVRTSGIQQVTPPDPSAIPIELTGGDGTWYYTGSVEVDGVKMALLENGSTGEGVYVRQGERWKRGVISSVGDETLLMTGPGGAPFRIKLGERGNSVPPNDLSVVPVQPPLSGIIGGGMTTIPVAPNTRVANPSMQVPPMPGVSATDNNVQVDTERRRRPRRRDRE